MSQDPYGEKSKRFNQADLRGASLRGAKLDMRCSEPRNLEACR